MDLETFKRNYKLSRGHEPSPEIIKKAIEKFGLKETPKKILSDISKKLPPVKIKIEITGLFIRVIFFIVSVACIYMSIYYSRLWLLDFLDPFKATILSMVMVFYLVFAPEGAQVFYKNNKKILGGFIIFTGIIVMVFSMVSTVAGQYNTRTKDIIVSGESTKNIRLEMLMEKKEQVKKSLDLLEKDFTLTQKQMDSIQPEDKKYDQLFWKNYRIKNDIKKQQEEYQKTIKEIEGFLSTEPDVIEKQERKDFYFFIWSITGLNKSALEFWLSLFPALFIDIIAPLGMFIALGHSKEM